MINTEKRDKGKGLFGKTKVYTPDRIQNISAEKKQKILNIISEGSQLTLLGLLIEQLGDGLGLDTPEFLQAKEVFASIRGILDE